MRFALSYSFGKDSTLALWRMLQQGHEPVCLIVTYNPEAGRSWFHGVEKGLMQASAQSLGIPLRFCVTGGDEYHLEMEKTLALAKADGAEACVFGDIDIQDHLEWNQARCRAAGLNCVLPLWQMPREQAVRAFLDSGFTAVVKCVQTPYSACLGKVLDDSVLQTLADAGADICGENGEYHTFVYGGPAFANTVPISLGRVIEFPNHQAIDIQLARQ